MKCPVCNGTGTVFNEECFACSGRGWVNSPRRSDERRSGCVFNVFPIFTRASTSSIKRRRTSLDALESLDLRFKRVLEAAKRLSGETKE